MAVVASGQSRVRLAPSNVDELLATARQALTEGDVDRAARLAEAAVQTGADHPLLLSLAAYRRELAGDLDSALDLLGRALERSPADPSILNSVGVCHSKAGRPEAALAAFDAALARRPGFAPARHGRGLALAALDRADEAWAEHEAAAVVDPAYPEPPGALAALAVERKDFGAARAFAKLALGLDPHQPAASLAMASVESHDGDQQGAAARLRALIDRGDLAPLHLASAQRQLADALDAMVRPDEAMAAYAAANETLRGLYAPAFREAGAEMGVEACARLLAWFDTADPRDWAAPAPVSTAGGEAGHVFLVGFPRSGTTLLEQVLASHPGIICLEEKPTLDDLTPRFFQDDAGLERLSRLDPDEAVRLGDDYWRKVRAFGVEPAGKVFVDKLPLNTLFLPLIAKLFPRARVILAIRDPRDVILSCFRRRFRPNTMVIEYTDLRRTAQFYGGVMALADVYRRKLDLPVHVHRHERLVEDFGGEARDLCAFLDLDWDPAMTDFAATARRRDIRTPSAEQVRRGLYREGIGQWRRYSGALAAVEDELRPWIERFGYPPA